MQVRGKPLGTCSRYYLEHAVAEREVSREEEQGEFKLRFSVSSACEVKRVSSSL